jgi:hypothetical protein
MLLLPTFLSLSRPPAILVSLPHLASSSSYHLLIALPLPHPPATSSPSCHFLVLRSLFRPPVKSSSSCHFFILQLHPILLPTRLLYTLWAFQDTWLHVSSSNHIWLYRLQHYLILSCCYGMKCGQTRSKWDKTEQIKGCYGNVRQRRVIYLTSDVQPY